MLRWLVVVCFAVYVPFEAVPAPGQLSVLLTSECFPAENASVHIG